MTLAAARLGQHGPHEAQVFFSAYFLNGVHLIDAVLKCLQRRGLPWIGSVIRPDRVKTRDMAVWPVSFGPHFIELADHMFGINQGERPAGGRGGLMVGEVLQIRIRLDLVADRHINPLVFAGPAVINKVFVKDRGRLDQGDFRGPLFVQGDIPGQGGENDDRPDGGQLPAVAADPLVGEVFFHLDFMMLAQIAFQGDEQRQREKTGGAADNEMLHVEIVDIGMDDQIRQGTQVAQQDDDHEVKQPSVFDWIHFPIPGGLLFSRACLPDAAPVRLHLATQGILGDAEFPAGLHCFKVVTV